MDLGLYGWQCIGCRSGVSVTSLLREPLICCVFKPIAAGALLSHITSLTADCRDWCVSVCVNAACWLQSCLKSEQRDFVTKLRRANKYEPLRTRTEQFRNSRIPYCVSNFRC